MTRFYRLQQEGGLSRVLTHVKKGRYAVFSAQRAGYNKKQRRQVHKAMGHDLRSQGYGFKTVHGVGQEVGHPPTKEKSVFVPNITRSKARRIAKRYKQDFYIHGHHGKSRLFATKKKQAMVHWKKTVPTTAQYHTKVGKKPFHFEDLPESKTTTEMRKKYRKHTPKHLTRSGKKRWLDDYLRMKQKIGMEKGIKSEAELPDPPTPSTADKSLHPNETNFTPRLPKPNPLGTPKLAVTKKMSALARFRLTPMYQKIQRKLRKQDRLNASDETFTPANLQEQDRNSSRVQKAGRQKNSPQAGETSKEPKESAPSFADSVIAILIDAGFDQNLTDVVEDGSGVLVYLDDRVGRRYKDVKNLLSEVADVELLETPEDNPTLGTYTYRVLPNENIDPASRIAAMGEREGKRGEGKSRKGEDDFRPHRPTKAARKGKGIGPQPDATNRKGQRVLQDVGEAFSPKKESIEENLGTNPRPRKGDLILDTRAKQHFEVVRELTNDKVEVRRTDGTTGVPAPESRFVGPASIESTDLITRGLTSGVMKRLVSTIRESKESFSSYLHTCPNCVTLLTEQEDAALRCEKCGYIAIFQGVSP